MSQAKELVTTDTSMTKVAHRWDTFEFCDKCDLPRFFAQRFKIHCGNDAYKQVAITAKAKTMGKQDFEEMVLTIENKGGDLHDKGFSLQATRALKLLILFKGART